MPTELWDKREPENTEHQRQTDKHNKLKLERSEEKATKLQ